MRTTRVLTGAIACLLAGWMAHASGADRTITALEVEVRGGPSMGYYATGKLHRGDHVDVTCERNGWLAISPPQPGKDSFSWVDASAVRLLGTTTATVVAPETPLRVGSQLKRDELGTQQVKVAQGTLLTVIGKGMTAGITTWLPVLPAPPEVRYIPASAVSADGGVTASPRTPPLASSSGTQAGGMDQRWLQAVQAEREGRIDQAIQLYRNLAQQVNRNDHELAERCLERVRLLRESQWRAAVQDQQTLAKSTATYYSGANAEGHLIPNTGSPYAAASYAAQPNQDPSRSVRLTAPGGTTAATVPGQWYGPAKLYRTTMSTPDHKPIYGFEPDNAQYHFYITPGPGMDADRFLHRNVYVYGTLSYDKDMRTWYMGTVQQISPGR